MSSSDFDFYLRFVKPLILNLQNPQDRCLAAAWVQKLVDNNSGSEDLRTNYLKLLLFVLQRKELRGIFLENPNHMADLKQLSEANLHEVARDLMDAEKQVRESPESGDYPPYSTDYSTDLLEYSAVQYIPNFGVHAYYAISNEPLPTWDRTEKAVFPRAAARQSTARMKTTNSKVGVKQSSPSLDEQCSREANKTIRKIASGDVMKSQTTAKTTMENSKPCVDGANTMEAEKRRCAFKDEKRGASPRRKSKTKTPLAAQLGATIEEEEEEQEMRKAPVWGSNLIGVSESPPAWQVPELPERDSVSMEYQGDALPSFLVCPYSPNQMCSPHQSRSPKRPPRCKQSQRKEKRQGTCSPCGKPPPERPSSAAEKQNCYSQEYQTNYFEAVSLSDAGLAVEPVCIPSLNPPPINRIRQFDVPYEGKSAVPRAQSPIPSDQRNFQAPQRPLSPNRCTNGVSRTRSPVPTSMYEGNAYGTSPSLEMSVEKELHVFEPYQQIPDSMYGRNIPAVYPGPNFVDGPQGQTLPSINERELAIRNRQLLKENQAEVDRIIRRTIRNTQKIDDDLKAFDKFITEYESPDFDV